MDAPRALLLSGGGRYADPWHPFAETSARLAAVLADCGLDVVTRDDVDAALTGLGGRGAWPDLLVLNVGQPRDGSPAPAPGPPAEGFTAYLRSGRPLLAVHSSSTGFDGFDPWEERLGGRWVHGVSMHPEHGTAAVYVLPGRHPVVAGLADFETLDERYTHLRVSPDVVAVAEHDHEGVRHPLVWVRQDPGGGGRARTAYDALGHDARGYDSPEHLELLRRLVRWLLDG
ncbi:hypothetical protein NUM3379_41540 [Kineococcus sp. NUM-3379]